MYSHLSGSILSIEDGSLSLLVEGTGLGFEIFVSPLTISRLSRWDQVSLSIYHHHTEASDMLFWFLDSSEKSLFQKLLKVNGVGGKTALNILGLGTETLSRAIHSQDDILLSTVPGIGKKTAQKILLDLKWSVDLAGFTDGSQVDREKKNPKTPPLLSQALIQMGYDRTRVEMVVREIDTTLPLADQTREAIQALSHIL